MKTWFWKKDKKAEAELVKPEGVSRWHMSKRDQQIVAIQTAYQEMVGMMGSISQNLNAQAETQRELLKAVQQVPGAMDHLKEIGNVSKQQVETLQVIQSQIEANERRDDMLSDTIQGFHSTIDQFGKSNRQSEQAIAGLATQAREAEEKVQTILLHSERRLSTVLWILIILAMSVLAAGIFLGVSGRPLVRFKPVDAVGVEAGQAVQTGEVVPVSDPGLIQYNPETAETPDAAVPVEKETDTAVNPELEEALRSL